jgi:hypothetical protein
MVYVRTRTFCCCLPVRFGVFILTTFGVLVGGLLSVGGWLQVANLGESFNNPFVFPYKLTNPYLFSGASPLTAGSDRTLYSNSTVHFTGCRIGVWVSLLTFLLSSI